MFNAFEAATLSTTHLPVIDITGLTSSALGDRQAVATEMRGACIRDGFFYITGHGVPDGLLRAAQEQTKAFFEQPEAAKRKVAKSLSDCNRGWEPLASQALDLDAPPDLKENFYLGLELPPDHPKVVTRRFNHGANQWPADLPGFKPTLRAYHAALRDVSERVMVGLALSLDLPENYFDTFDRDPLTTLRLLHYPPHPVDAVPGQAGAGAHTDFGALTFLLQDDNGGLQVRQADGTWINATPLPNAFVFNIGDAIARWTNDLYRSTVHRVVNISGRHRYSMAFFYSGNADHPLDCLPNCIKPGESPKYPTLTVEEHMRECYRLSYGAAAAA